MLCQWTTDDDNEGAKVFYAGLGVPVSGIVGDGRRLGSRPGWSALRSVSAGIPQLHGLIGAAAG